MYFLSVVSNVLNMDNLPSKVIEILGKSGYRFPIEEATKLLMEASYLTPLQSILQQSSVLTPEARKEIGEAFIRDMQNKHPLRRIFNVNLYFPDEYILYSDNSSSQEHLRNHFFTTPSKNIVTAWSTFFRLVPHRGYVIARLVYIKPTVQDDPDNIFHSIPRTVRLILTLLAAEDCREEFEAVTTKLSTFIQELTSWDEYKFKHPQFQNIPPDKLAKSITNEAIEGANLMKATAIKQLLINIRASRNKSIKKINTSQYQFLIQRYNGDEEFDSVINLLEVAHLIKRGTEDMSYQTTDLGNMLLNKSYWMTALLISILNKFGVSNQDIAVEFYHNDSENDILVSIGNHLLLFELKDSRFERGHADKFIGRIREISPNYAVIWATMGYEENTQKYLSTYGTGTSAKIIKGGEEITSPTELVMIEGINDVEIVLEPLILGLKQAHIKESIRPLLPSSLLNIDITGSILAEIGITTYPQTTEIAAKYKLPFSNMIIEYSES